MIEEGILPQKVTFETLYKGLIQSNMLRTWRRLKKKLEEESFTFGSELEQYHLKPYRSNHKVLLDGSCAWRVSRKEQKKPDQIIYGRMDQVYGRMDQVWTS
ncbi:hypothetical protein AgCh_008458 [Apium graveolens]